MRAAAFFNREKIEGESKKEKEKKTCVRFSLVVNRPPPCMKMASLSLHDSILSLFLSASLCFELKERKEGE